MKPLLSFFLPVLFFWLLPTLNYAAMQSHHANAHHAVCAEVGMDTKVKKTRLHKSGPFTKIKATWHESNAKIKRRIVQEKERASFMAKLALYLFIGATLLRLLFISASTVTPVIGTIITLAFLASLVISLVVLFSDENRKSKAIAKALVIIYAISVLLALLLFIFIILLLAGL